MATNLGLTQLAHKASGIRVKGQGSRFFGLLTFDSGQPQRKKYDTCVSPVIANFVIP